MVSDLAGSSSRTGKKSWIDTAEDFAVGVLLLGPILGMFSPPEGYFYQHSYAVSAAITENDFPISAAISRFVYIVILFLFMRHWQDYLRELRYGVWVLILFSFYVASTLWSEEPATTIKQSLHYFEHCILAAHIMWRYTGKEALRLLERLLAIMTLMSYLVLIVKPDLGHSLDLAGTGYAGTWRGCTTSKNALGAVAALAIVISAASLAHGPREDRRLSAFVFLANLILLYEARSQTSTIGLAGALTAGSTVYLARWSGGRILIGTGVIALALVVSALIVSSDSLAALLGRSASLTGRTDVWRAVVPLILHRPLLGYGVGFWAFNSRDKLNIWQELGWAPPHAHNDYLDLMLQIGAIGMLISVLNNLRAIRQGIYSGSRGDASGLAYMMIVVLFVVRASTETISIFPGTNTMLIVVLSQMQIWKSYSEMRQQLRQRRRYANSAPPTPTLSFEPQAISGG